MNSSNDLSVPQDCNYKALIYYFLFSVPKPMRSQPKVLQRYIWYMVVVVASAYGYTMFSLALTNINPSYQWILAMLSPFFKDFFMALFKYAYRIAELDGMPDKPSTMLVLAHYMTTRHAVFLAIMVGGVATPESSACIMATDYAKTLYQGLRIIYKNKYRNETNIQGTIAF